MISAAEVVFRIGGGEKRFQEVLPRNYFSEFRQFI